MRTQAGRRSPIAAGTWTVDRAGSHVGFKVKHMLIATLEGRFDRFNGTLEVDHDGLANGSGDLEVSSLNTGDEVRDERVRASPEFFDCERHPLITFASSGVEELGDGRFRMAGVLNMRGVAREISLDGQLRTTPSDADTLSLTLAGELDRKDFGITWSETLDSGGALVGNAIKLVLDLRLRASARPPAPAAG